MIELTKINDEGFYLNCDIIEHVEEVPHTVIRTIHGNTYIVKEKAIEIANKVIEYKRKIYIKETSF